MLNLLKLVSLLLLLGTFYLVRPPFLGGNVTYVMVAGHSMEPTMYTGDLALAWQQDSYAVGDVVTFRVEEGGMVIHRVIGGNGVDGYRMQGDNNGWVDQWEPTHAQVQGKALFFVPRLGAVFGYLQDPLRIAIAVGLFFGYISLAGAFLSKSGGGSRERRRRLRERIVQRKRGLASWLSA